MSVNSAGQDQILVQKGLVVAVVGTGWCQGCHAAPAVPEQSQLLRGLQDTALGRTRNPGVTAVPQCSLSWTAQLTHTEISDIQMVPLEHRFISLSGNAGVSSFSGPSTQSTAVPAGPLLCLSTSQDVNYCQSIPERSRLCHQTQTQTQTRQCRCPRSLGPDPRHSRLSMAQGK